MNLPNYSLYVLHRVVFIVWLVGDMRSRVGLNLFDIIRTITHLCLNLKSKSPMIEKLLDYFYHQSGKMSSKNVDQELLTFFHALSQMDGIKSKDALITYIEDYAKRLPRVKSDVKKEYSGMRKDLFSSSFKNKYYDITLLLENSLVSHFTRLKSIKDFVEQKLMKWDPILAKYDLVFQVKSLGSIILKSMGGVELMDSIRTRAPITSPQELDEVSTALMAMLDKRKIPYSAKKCSGDWKGFNLVMRIDDTAVEVQFELKGCRPHEEYEKQRLKKHLEALCQNLRGTIGPEIAWYLTIYIFKNLGKSLVTKRVGE
jgi:hypothetical protein